MALTCLHGPVGALQSRAEKLSLRHGGGAPIPQGIDSSGWRRRGEGNKPEEAKGEGEFRRDPGARVRAGAHRAGAKRSHLNPGLSCPSGDETRRPGRMAEVGGEGPPAVTVRLRIPEDLSPEVGS